MKKHHNIYEIEALFSMSPLFHENIHWYQTTKGRLLIIYTDDRTPACLTYTEIQFEAHRKERGMAPPF